MRNGNQCALHQIIGLYVISLSLDYFIITTIMITFLTVFILTHPVNFLCGRKSRTLGSWALTDSFYINGQRENVTPDLRGERHLLWWLRQGSQENMYNCTHISRCVKKHVMQRYVYFSNWQITHLMLCTCNYTFCLAHSWKYTPFLI